jgi:hypothetical protein
MNVDHFIKKFCSAKNTKPALYFGQSWFEFRKITNCIETGLLLKILNTTTKRQDTT